MLNTFFKYISPFALVAMMMFIPTPSALAETININTADAITLSQLKGIGKVKSKAIVAFRKENGRFQSIQELTHVKGIGEATFNKLRKDASINKGISHMPTKSKTPKRTAKTAKPSKTKTSS